MSHENTEIVRAVYERWADGDFLTADVFDPEAELVMPPELPDTGTYAGVDAIAEYTRGFLEPWTRITIEAEEIIDAGDRVVVNIVQRGVGSSSGAPTELSYAHVWTFRDGRAVRIEAYRERAAAASAAGL